MAVEVEPEAGRPIPVTCFTGFLGAGKTSTILGLIKQLPKDYKVVLLKNEYGDVEVDSILAEQSNISGVSEILNGCLCCTMVGLVENALMEIKEKMNPDRIIIESSGSAFPATLALRIRDLEPKGFKLDGVVTVVDCVNFRGYEDTSPSAKLQARYTDLLLLSKHQLVSERDLDSLHDHLSELNEDTPRIKVSAESPIAPELVFGLDTKLFTRQNEEGVDWEAVAGGSGGGWHGDEVETKNVWRGGRKPGSKKGKAKGKGKEVADGHAGHDHAGHDHDHNSDHPDAHSCDCEDEDTESEQAEISSDVQPLDREILDAALSKLSFEVYRVKGIVRLASSSSKGWATHILNYAFGRYDLTPIPSLDANADVAGAGADVKNDKTGELRGASVRLTMMGERGEVARRAKRFAESLGDGFQVS